LLKTRNLLIFRDAKNAEHGKIAPNWNVSGTWDFRPANEFLEEDRYSPAAASSFQLTLACCLPNCQNAFLDNFRFVDNPLGIAPFLNQHTYNYRVQIDRRTFLEYLGAVALTPVLTGSQQASGMWGLIAKMTLLPGRRDEMVEILKESAADMPGCLSYVVAKDATDENTIWITEVWDSMASHDASLSLPAVKNAIPRGKAIVSNFEKIAVTSPVWGAGLPTAHAH
jgi:quinol monooxygenase YgiN